MADTVPHERAMGFWMCLALVIGNIIGAGVFLLPAALAPFGINAVLGWLVTIGGALCLAYVLAEFAKVRAGGPYAYAREAFGPLTAFMVMWSYWVSLWPGNAAIAIAATSYLSRLFPVIAKSGMAAFLAVSLIWLFTAINIRGARTAGVTQIITTVLKLTPLVAVFLLAIWLLGTGAERHVRLVPVPVSAGGIAGAAALALWAVMGFECATLPVGKISDPERTVPRATIAGTLIAGLFSLLATAGVFLLLPGTEAAASPAPFADAVRPFLGPGAVTLIAAFAVISALGAMNGWVLCSGEVPLALAREGVLPAWFAVTTPRGTPVRALLVSSTLTSLLILTNYSRSMTGLFTFMGLITSGTALFFYLACAAAALKLRLTPHARAARVLAMIGLIYCLWAFWGVGAESTLWSIALLLSGLPIFWMVRGAPVPAQSTA